MPCHNIHCAGPYAKDTHLSKGSNAVASTDDNVPTWWRTNIKWCQVLQQQQRMPGFLPSFICPEVFWAAKHLAMGTDIVFWFIHGRREMSVAQLELVSLSWFLCLFQELFYACSLWPVHLPWFVKCSQKAKDCVWHSGKDLPGRCSWAVPGKSHDKQHQQPAALILLEGCQCLCIPSSRTWQGRGNSSGVIKEGNRWLS